MGLQKAFNMIIILAVIVAAMVAVRFNASAHAPSAGCQLFDNFLGSGSVGYVDAPFDRGDTLTFRLAPATHPQARADLYVNGERVDSSRTPDGLAYTFAADGTYAVSVKSVAAPMTFTAICEAG